MDQKSYKKFIELYDACKKVNTLEEKVDLISQANALNVIYEDTAFNDYDENCPKPNEFILNLIKNSGYNPEHYKNKRVMPGLCLKTSLFLILDKNSQVKMIKGILEKSPCFAVHDVYGLAGDGIFIDTYGHCFGTFLS